MSHKPSACVPPPTDYAPKPRRPGLHKSRGRLDRDERRYHSGGRRDEDENDQHQKSAKTEAEVDADEDDPLDAYMKSLETQTKELKSETVSRVATIAKDTTVTETDRARGIRLDIDDIDDLEESYYKYVEEQKVQCDNQEEEEHHDLVDYDTEGNIISVRKIKRDVEPLEYFDHSSVNYEPFERNFYQEHEEIAKLSPERSDELRRKLEIKVSENSAPKPVCSFAHFKFDEKLMKVIRRSEYFQPTPIQAQAIPAALSGRNIIGIAVTGSGKTAAYIWPMIVHIMRQPDLKEGDGPIGLVLVPTRELAQQVYTESKKFSNSYKIKVVCAYGGGSKYEQARDLELGAEIVVATPGRLIDLIKSGATNLKRVTYLVLDEADTFFKMGFEAQVRSICDHVRPDRQTLLFSATFKHEVEHLARTVTSDPVKIIQKTLGEANEDVSQHIIVLPSAKQKWDWLTARLVEFTSTGSVLIFVTRIVNCTELHDNLRLMGKDTLLLHGDMEQVERNRVITAFKRKDGDIMLATDVAARGLDIAHIRTVINYDVARDIDTHIHRVGRTGRAGTKGDAYTLLSADKDKEFAGHLVKNLESSRQKVSEELMRLAMQSHNFRRTRDRHRKDHRDHSRSFSDKSSHRPYHTHRSDSKRDYRSYCSNQPHNSSGSNRETSSRQSSGCDGRPAFGKNEKYEAHRDVHRLEHDDNRKRSKFR